MTNYYVFVTAKDRASHDEVKAYMRQQGYMGQGGIFDAQSDDYMTQQGIFTGRLTAEQASFLKLKFPFVILTEEKEIQRILTDVMNRIHGGVDEKEEDDEDWNYDDYEEWDEDE